MPNAFMQEIFVSFLGAYEAVLTNMIPIADGRATVPEGPGWGTEINVEALEEFPALRLRYCRERTVLGVLIRIG